MRYKIRKLINHIRDCFGKNIYLFLDGIKNSPHFSQIPSMNRGIGTNIGKILLKGHIKMFPNAILFKNRISQ